MHRAKLTVKMLGSLVLCFSARNAYFDGTSSGTERLGSICFLISSTVGNLPSCFLEKISFPSKTTSKIPPSEGFRAIESFLFSGMP